MKGVAMGEIVSIVGARPQFIKASAVAKRLKERGINHFLIHTGQHYDRNMSDIFFEELMIDNPERHLDIGSGEHGEQTGKMLIAIESELMNVSPELVIVYGDTNTTLAGALAAVKQQFPVAHIEAGLRSFDKAMPEEVNRVLTDHASELLFVPTVTAVQNLEREAITKNVYNVGDVMLDTALQVSRRMGPVEQDVLRNYGVERDNFVLVTIHRQENTDNKQNLVSIMDALRSIASKDISVFFPVHPRTRKSLEKYGIRKKDFPLGLVFHKPVSYGDMIVLERNANVIITDSGGVQKEAYFFDTPALVPRKNSEWVEIVESGWNIVTGAGTDRILSGFDKLWKKDRSGIKRNFYGDGNASGRISEIIADYISKQ